MCTSNILMPLPTAIVAHFFTWQNICSTVAGLPPCEDAGLGLYRHLLFPEEHLLVIKDIAEVTHAELGLSRFVARGQDQYHLLWMD